MGTTGSDRCRVVPVAAIVPVFPSIVHIPGTGAVERPLLLYPH